MPAPKKKAVADNLMFESTMKSIGKLLNKLENPETPLGESLDVFEEGIGLIRDAQKSLAHAEQKIKVLLEKNDVLIESDFDADLED